MLQKAGTPVRYTRTVTGAHRNVKLRNIYSEYRCMDSTPSKTTHRVTVTAMRGYGPVTVAGASVADGSA
jgi:hypothetical protein